jgi:hypothetical protein
VLDLIGQLYAVERERAAVGVSEELGAQALAIRATARPDRSAAIVAAIHPWAHQPRRAPRKQPREGHRLHARPVARPDAICRLCAFCHSRRHVGLASASGLRRSAAMRIVREAYQTGGE